MKILLISEFFPGNPKLDVHGGVELRTYKIASYLAKSHQVTVISTKVRGQRLTPLNNIHILRVGLWRQYSRLTEILPRLSFIIAAIWVGLKLDFDIVEGSSFLGWLPALAISKIKNKPRILLLADMVRDYVSEASFFTRQLLIQYEKWLLKQYWHGLICISHTVKNKLIASRFTNNQPQVIYCGVDNDLISNISTSKSSKPTISCVSRLVPYKRVADLVSATKMLDFPYLQVNIIGSGEEFVPLQKMINKFRLSNQIHLLGFKDSHNEVLKIIKNSTIFCLPSIVEGFGIATIEAFAAGVPGVLADIPINREITGGQGALFFQPTNGQDLANKIKLLLTHKRLYTRLQKETQVVAKKYDWNKICQQTGAYYARVYHN